MARYGVLKTRWDHPDLFAFAHVWITDQRNQKRAWGRDSPWWNFLYRWPKNIDNTLEQFIQGEHQFSPLKVYYFPDESVTLWSCSDRLVLACLLNTIKPTFPHILSSRCLHMQGPNGVKQAIDLALKAVQSGRFRFCFRGDIASYYASIDRDILVDQLQSAFQDPKLLKYLTDIVTIPIDDNANIYNPKKGIPLRSSLSPFFGALYLTPLDRAFENRKGIFYLRFMDDILLFAETKRQFARAMRILKNMLAQLKLKLSRRKTKTSRLHYFHFLGIAFEGARTPANSKIQAAIRLHTRSLRRALARVTCMKADSIPMDEVQKYLRRWAAWWSFATKRGLSDQTNLRAWVAYALKVHDPLAWVGRGMIGLI